MHAFDILTIVLFLGAILSYLNARFFKQPTMLAFMIGSLCISVGLLLLQPLGFEWASHIIHKLSDLDFSETYLYEILCFLLFAGALRIDAKEMASQKWMILFLSTLSVVISTFVLGSLTYVIFNMMGFQASYFKALLFGALISPTDPALVMDILFKSSVQRALRIKIVGEAIFNDGVAIVLFVTLLGMDTLAESPHWDKIFTLLVQQVAGSILLGLVLGWVMRRMLAHIKAFDAQVLLTLGFVSFGYDLALRLGVSAPITVVISAVFFHNYKRAGDLPEKAYQELYDFWALLDELLNSLIFILVGLELLDVKVSFGMVECGLLTVVATLFARFISVWVPLHIFSYFKLFPKNTAMIMTWAGLRGGVSLALVLTLPNGDTSDAMVLATYIVVLFSILIQPIFLKRLALKSV